MFPSLHFCLGCHTWFMSPVYLPFLLILRIFGWTFSCLQAGRLMAVATCWKKIAHTLLIECKQCNAMWDQVLKTRGSLPASSGLGMIQMWQRSMAPCTSSVMLPWAKKKKMMDLGECKRSMCCWTMCLRWFPHSQVQACQGPSVMLRLKAVGSLSHNNRNFNVNIGLSPRETKNSRCKTLWHGVDICSHGMCEMHARPAFIWTPALTAGGSPGATVCIRFWHDVHRSAACIMMTQLSEVLLDCLTHGLSMPRIHDGYLRLGVAMCRRHMAGSSCAARWFRTISFLAIQPICRPQWSCM